MRRAARATAAATLLGTVTLSGETRLGGLDGAAVYQLIGAPLVTNAPLSEQYGLEGADGTGLNFIRWLHDNATANRTAIRDDTLPGSERPLLYRLLRHALLTEMDRIAFGQLLTAGVVSATDQPERELVAMVATGAPLTAYERIERARGAARLRSRAGLLPDQPGDAGRTADCGAGPEGWRDARRLLAPAGRVDHRGGHRPP